MATIREIILSYPGLSDCEDFLDNVVLPSRGLEGSEIGADVSGDTQKLVAADLYAPLRYGRRFAGLHGEQVVNLLSAFLVRRYGEKVVS